MQSNKGFYLKKKPEEKVDTDDKGPYMLHSEAENVTKEMRNKKATGYDNVLGDILTLTGRDSLKQTTDQQHI
jgi:hypothetical protein